MRSPRSFGVSRKHRKSAQSVGTRSTMRSRRAEIRQREARTARPAVGCERRVCGARRIKGARVGIVALESTRRSRKTVCPCRKNKKYWETSRESRSFARARPRTTDRGRFSVASVCRRAELLLFRGRSLRRALEGHRPVPLFSNRARVFFTFAHLLLYALPLPHPPVFARVLHAAAASRAALAPAIFSSIFARRSSESSKASIALT